MNRNGFHNLSSMLLLIFYCTLTLYHPANSDRASLAHLFEHPSSFEGDEFRKESSVPPISEEQYECSCDLTEHYCEALCCCDIDCSINELRAFGNCDKRNAEDDYQCYDNAKAAPKKFPHNLFCIVYDNYQERNFYKDQKGVTSLDDFNKLLEATDESNFLPLTFHPPHWVADDKPFIHITQNSQPSFLTIPSADLSNVCSNLNYVEPMQEIHNECFNVVSPLEESCVSSPLLTAENFYKNIFVVKPDANKVAISPYLCQEIFEYCVKVEETPPPIYIPEKLTCLNAVAKMKYDIFYSNSNIGKMTAKFILTNITSHNKTVNLKQTYEVNFHWFNEEAVFSSKSGNPGYQRGLNVLGGSWNGIDTIEFNAHPSFPVAQAGENGNCQLNHANALKFGIDISTSCFVEARADSLKTLCRELYQQMREYFSSSLPSHVGVFGDSDPRRLGEWIPVLNWNSLLPSDMCLNIPLGLHCEILYANIGLASNVQAKIVGIQLRYAQPTNLLMMCVNHECKLPNSTKFYIRTSLSFTVSFVDVTEKPSPSYAPLPIINLKLPYDFLYPFVSKASCKDCFFRFLIMALTITRIL